MKKITSLIIILFILISCNNDDNDEIYAIQKSNRIIKSYSSNDKDIDSLFYKDDKLISIKNYVFGYHIYTINYEYNNQDQLSKIYEIARDLQYKYTNEYVYNTNGSLKSIKKEFRDFGSSFSTINYNFTYDANKIIIVDDDYREKTHERIAILDSKNRIKYIEKQKQSLDGYFTFCEYTYDNNGNVISVKTKAYEDSVAAELNFEYDNKINPFPAIDFKLPNGLSIKKLESISNGSIFSLLHINPYTEGISIEFYDGFLDFENTNNATQVKTTDSKRNYSFQYDNNNYPFEINYKTYNNLNGFIKITYK